MGLQKRAAGLIFGCETAVLLRSAADCATGSCWDGAWSCTRRHWRDTGIHWELPAKKQTGESGLGLQRHNLAPVEYPNSHRDPQSQWDEQSGSSSRGILVLKCSRSSPPCAPPQCPGTLPPSTGAPPSKICQPGGCQSSILWIRDSSGTCCPQSFQFLTLCHARTS